MERMDFRNWAENLSLLLFHLQVERASFSELTPFLIVSIIAFILYAFAGSLRAAYLAFTIPGPKAYPLIGNCLILKEKDRKCTND
jgi:hypothetical protein